MTGREIAYKAFHDTLLISVMDTHIEVEENTYD
jgi:hypothetical protein